jgi:hypothetical protein
LENLVCDLSIEIVKSEKILPGVTTVQQNPIIKHYLTRLNAFKTIQFGNLDDIKKKGWKRNDSTTARSAVAKKTRKLEDSDDDIPVPQQDITLCDSDNSEESLEILPVSTRLIAKAEMETEKKKMEAYKQQLAATNKKATKKSAHASPTTSPIKTEMYSPRIAKSSTKKNEMENTNEDAKPSAKKKDIIAVDQMLAPYLPLLQNLAVMMNDGNSMANLAFLMKAQEDRANINSDHKNLSPDQQTHISEKNGSGNLENVVKSENSEKDDKAD